MPFAPQDLKRAHKSPRSDLLRARTCFSRGGQRSRQCAAVTGLPASSGFLRRRPEQRSCGCDARACSCLSATDAVRATRSLRRWLRCNSVGTTISVLGLLLERRVRRIAARLQRGGSATTRPATPSPRTWLVIGSYAPDCSSHPTTVGRSSASFTVDEHRDGSSASA
jgi:hypothetical protein